MTRTQKLGLCTWLPEDPVCLAEVNDNFSRLDTSGARALRQAEAGLIALGGVMAAQAHQGGHAGLFRQHSGGRVFGHGSRSQTTRACIF